MTERDESSAKDPSWGWFVWPNRPETNQPHVDNDESCHISTISGEFSVPSSSRIGTDFQMVQQEITTKSCSASHHSRDHLVSENNFQINDQYVDLNGFGTLCTLAMKPMEDDMKSINIKDADEHKVDKEQDTADGDEEEVKSELNHHHDEEVKEANDAVMISQTLTLKTRNEELERERDALHSETLQLRMQTECLRQTNDHIIAAQQLEIEKLQSKNREVSNALNVKEEQLKAAQKQIAILTRDRDNLKKKLHDVCYNRLYAMDKNDSSVDITTKSEVFVSDKHVIYGCIQCAQHLFDSRAMIQRDVEIDDNTFGLIVDGLFNNNDATMGPMVCKTFLNGMYKVKEIFCDSCLSTFGWKICESFDEWNSFYSNKYCIDISNIRQISTISGN